METYAAAAKTAGLVSPSDEQIIATCSINQLLRLNKVLALEFVPHR